MSEQAKILKFPTVACKPERWECSECGADATVETTCGCRAKLVPALERAMEAIVASPEKSDRAIAKEIGVGNATVSRARKSTVSHDTVEKRVGRDGKSRRVPETKTNGKKINLGQGEGALSDACRRAMASESGVLTNDAKRLGIDVRVYGQMRAIVMIADREDIGANERALARQAIQIMNKSRQTAVAYRLIQPIAEQIWGTKPNGTRAGPRMEKRRLDKFNRSIGAICGACAACDHITVPYLSEESVALTMSELADAANSLQGLITRVKGARK